MNLIHILDEGDFMGIRYPQGLHRSMRGSQIKTISSDIATGTVFMVWYDQRSVEFIYKNVGDPSNPGSPFPSLAALRDWIMSILGGSVDISNFTFEDGNNVIFLDGNNFIFNN